jgi:hypothetical protein
MHKSKKKARRLRTGRDSLFNASIAQHELANGIFVPHSAIGVACLPAECCGAVWVRLLSLALAVCLSPDPIHARILDGG